MFSRLSARLAFSTGASSHKTFKFFKRRHEDVPLARFGRLESLPHHKPVAAAEALEHRRSEVAEPKKTEVVEQRKPEVVFKRWENPKMNIPHYYVSADLSLDPLAALYANISGTKPDLLQIFSPFFVSALQLSLRKLADFSTIADIDRFYKIDGYTLEYLSVSGGKKETKRSVFRFGGNDSAGTNLALLRVYDFAGTGVAKGSLPISDGSNFCIFLGDFSHRLTEKGHEVKRSVTLSFDHRVVDGAKGAELLQKISEVFNEPLKVIH